MSDNPLKAADMIKIHEVGQREGFVSVYTFSSNRYSWNLSCDPEKEDDVAYYVALIDYLKNKYPIDSERVYVSGFSNGAGMAMIFALSHPDLVAAGFQWTAPSPMRRWGISARRSRRRTSPRCSSRARRPRPSPSRAAIRKSR